MKRENSFELILEKGPNQIFTFTEGLKNLDFRDYMMMEEARHSSSLSTTTENRFVHFIYLHECA